MRPLVPPVLRRMFWNPLMAGWILLLLGSMTPPGELPAQSTTDGRRAQAERAELEAALREIEEIMQSRGYSPRIRNAKREEARIIQERLRDGDIQVGDQVTLAVFGEDKMSGTFLVGMGRTLTLPGMPEIPLAGVLRSELRDHLVREIGKQVRNPQVRVQTTIRLSIFGSVGQPGFYQVPAEVMATDAFMLAGGPTGDADLRKVQVRRGDRVIWNQEAFQQAMTSGLTVDQLNLRAGDQLILDQRKRGGVSLQTILGGIGAITSLAFIITRF